ncbi:uncharacterized protein LOC135713089 [Ochlerotatus camptorhynchus]|uniref:uncharacterized protein LOC135713089 n=1 Tax=Ochlerotatus camptorhynchus TaxID=644619 RepID=UPI0031D8F4CA
MQSNVQQLWSVPSWLSDRFLQEVIRKAKGDGSVTLCHDCKIRPGGKDGVRHASDLFRATVHYRSKKFRQEQAVDLMLKVNRSRNGAQFTTEIQIYREILPAMEQALKNVGESLEAPNYFYSYSDPQNVIIMEDLFPSGWVQRNRLNDFDDAKAVVIVIAKFHAASYVSNGKVRISNFYNLDYRRVKLIINKFIDSLNTRPGCSQIGAKLHTLKPRVEEKLKQIYSPSRQHFNVLNHGDINVSNLWFKTHSNNRAAMIDFQRCHWGSPAIDLLSLMDFVLDRDLRRTHSDRLVREYYQSLTAYLTRMGLRGSPMSLQDLVQELKRCAFLEFVHFAMRKDLESVNREDYNRIDTGNLDVEIQQELTEMLRRGVLE